MADEPKWMQLAAVIRQRIDSGQYRPGDQIPSEHALVQEFSVSRTTIRRAIESLKEDGIVRSWHGLGTFVAR